MFNRLSNAVKARVQQRIVALMLPTWTNGQRPEYWDRTFENYVNEGYKKNEIIYACVSVTSNTASSVGCKVHERASDALTPDHPLQLLINRPNRMMSEYDFLSWTLTQQMLAGIAYWQKIRNQAGQVQSLWPIRPDYVRPVINEQGLSEYRIRINGIELETIDTADMLSFPLADPLNMFDHVSPVEVLSRTADVDNAITDFIKMLMERGAMPPGILSSKLKLRNEDVEDIRRRWAERYGGYTNWMQPAVLDSDASYQRIGLTMAEMQFEGIDGRNESRICAVYQIPPILVGTTSGLMRSTFSNYESARKQWWEDSLSGKYKKLLDGLQVQLADEYNDQPVLKWDFSNVAALQEERDGRFTRANASWQAGTMLLNEARKEMGLPDLGAEGNVLLRSNMSTAVTDNPADDAPTTSDSGVEVEQDDPATDAARERLAQKALVGSSAFVYLDLANNSAVTQIQNQLKTLWGDKPGVVWQDPPTLHVTLCYCTSADDDRLIGIAKGVKSAPIEIISHGLGVFENADERALYLDVEKTTALRQIQSVIYKAFEQRDLPMSPFSEPKAYQAHITLAYIPVGVDLPTFSVDVHTVSDSVVLGRDEYQPVETVVLTEQGSKANATTASDDTDAKVKPNDPLRWEAMYQQIVKKVHAEDKKSVEQPSELEPVAV